MAIGNFDGVHRGHRAVLDAARLAALRLSAPFGVVTFEPHPREVLTPTAAPRRLTSFRRKAEILSGLGVEQLVVLPFGSGLMRLSPEQFAAEVLSDRLGVRAVAAGVDFRFGHKRAGDMTRLRELGREMSFEVEAIDPVAIDGTVCSSTDVRALLEDGRIAEANAMLGYRFEVEGIVQPGDARGRTMGFPTANIHPVARRPMLPGRGVYAVLAGLPRKGGMLWHEAVAYIGDRPTFDGRTLLLEVYILQGVHNLYGKRLRVAFLERVRGEQTFACIEQLKAQIARDCTVARRIHGTLPV